MTMLPRIFVLIPSYRDRECQHTVRDLFDRAAHPQRIFAGIAWQYIEVKDAVCFIAPCPYPEQVRTDHIDARESRGACWARTKAFRLWQEEEYVLMIDAHTRFAPGWDEVLIDMLAACSSPKALLTTYPNGYTPHARLDNNGILRMAFREFQKTAPDQPPKLSYRSLHIAQENIPSTPWLTGIVSHNFIFAPATLFQEVPIDPNIYFFGDDLAYAARVWTHGWDIYSPNRSILYHLWDRRFRRGHCEDSPEISVALDKNTDERVAHLLGMKTTRNPAALVELSSYALGAARTLADYQRFCGIDFATRRVSARACQGLFPVETVEQLHMPRHPEVAPRFDTAR